VTNLLFVADVIGSPGREVLRALLPDLRRRHDVHLVICNCENSAAGFGVTREVARDLFEAGCDVLTGGNHLWDKKDSMDYLAEEPRLVRPANLPAGTPGEGWRVFKATNGAPVGVVNLLGRVFMKEAEDPFRTADAASRPLRVNARSCSSIFTRKRRLKRSRSAGTWTDVPRRWWARTRTSRPPTTVCCRTAPRSCAMPA
jgi:calcineurin-like phosphoesterase